METEPRWWGAGEERAIVGYRTLHVYVSATIDDATLRAMEKRAGEALDQAVRELKLWASQHDLVVTDDG